MNCNFSKRLLFMVLVVVLAALMLTACGNNQTASETASETISQKTAATTNTEADLETTEQSTSVEAQAEEISVPESPETSDAYDATYLFENSQIEYLTDNDVLGYDKVLLQTGINEIYARHGYAFKSERWQKYFSMKSWYIAVNDFDETDLSEIEKANIAFLQDYDIKLSNTQIDIDFDMDGKKDQLDVSGTKLYSHTDFGYGYEEDPWDESYMGTLVTDIDITDGKLELLIYDAGPSADYTINLCEEESPNYYQSVADFSAQYYDHEITGDGTFKFEIFKNMLYGIGTYTFDDGALVEQNVEMPTFVMNESLEDIQANTIVSVDITSENEWGGPYTVRLSNAGEGTPIAEVTLQDYDDFIAFMEHYLEGFTYMYYGD